MKQDSENIKLIRFVILTIRLQTIEQKLLYKWQLVREKTLRQLRNPNDYLNTARWTVFCFWWTQKALESRQNVNTPSWSLSFFSALWSALVEIFLYSFWCSDLHQHNLANVFKPKRRRAERICQRNIFCGICHNWQQSAKGSDVQWKYPPKFFDGIIVDKCHNSIYNV